MRTSKSDRSLTQRYREAKARTPKADMRDEPYAFDQWKRQRSFRRYLYPFDCWAVITSVFWPTLVVVLISVALGLYIRIGCEQHGLPYFSEEMTATAYSLPFTTTSFAVSLLITFRTNEGYRRWWDGRRNIGRICTAMKNIMRQGIAWFPEKDRTLLEALQHWAVTLPHMLLFHCCEGHDMDVVLKPLLLPHELDWLQRQEKPTYGVMTAITHIVRAAGLSPEEQQSMDLEIRGAMSEFTHCDDILLQPLPTAYTRHTSRFLMVWLVCLPVPIWEAYTWATPVICGAIAFFLLGIEHIGIMIEEPFSALPIDKIAHRLHKDVDEMMRQNYEGKKLMADYRGQTTPPKPQSPEVRIDMADKDFPDHPLPASTVSEQPTFNPTTPLRLDPKARLGSGQKRHPRHDRVSSSTLWSGSAAKEQLAEKSKPPMELARVSSGNKQPDHSNHSPRDESFFSRPALPASIITEQPSSSHSQSGMQSPASQPQGTPDRPSRDEAFFSRPALPTARLTSDLPSPGSGLSSRSERPHRDEGFFSRPTLPTARLNSDQPSPNSGSSLRSERPHRDEGFFSRPAVPVPKPGSSSRDEGRSGRPDKDEAFFSRPALPSSAIADHPMVDNPMSRDQSPSPKSDAPQTCVNMAEDYLSRSAKLPPFNSPQVQQPSQPKSSPRSERPRRDEAFFSRPTLLVPKQRSPSQAEHQSDRPRRDEKFFSRPAVPSSAIADHPMFDQSPLGSRTPSPRSGTPNSPGTCLDLAEGYLSRPAKLPPFKSAQPTFGHINLTSSTDLASVCEHDPELSHSPMTPRDDSAHNASGILRTLNLRPRSVPRSQSLKRDKDSKQMLKPSRAEALAQAHSKTSLLNGQESSAPVDVKPAPRKLLRTTQW
ncbi:hypothetical protein WJX74_003791 [Apatococcus lobatus]|uniref:Uncharacterized protein n=1 Tax=Apatococcus lobatus TaxID=904363 RepID=A0AAW1S0G5_9CHLO